MIDISISKKVYDLVGSDPEVVRAAKRALGEINNILRNCTMEIGLNITT